MIWSLLPLCLGMVVLTNLSSLAQTLTSLSLNEWPLPFRHIWTADSWPEESAPLCWALHFISYMLQSLQSSPRWNANNLALFSPGCFALSLDRPLSPSVAMLQINRNVMLVKDPLQFFPKHPQRRRWQRFGVVPFFLSLFLMKAQIVWSPGLRGNCWWWLSFSLTSSLVRTF